MADTPINMEQIKADYQLSQNNLAARYEEQQARLRGEIPPEDEALELVPFSDVPKTSRVPVIDPAVTAFVDEAGGLPPPFTTLQPRRRVAAAMIGNQIVKPPHLQFDKPEPETLEETAIRGEPGDVAPFGRLCMCGEPNTLGVVHRTDGPCYRIRAGHEAEDHGARASRRLKSWREKWETEPATPRRTVNPWPWIALTVIVVAGMFSAIAGIIAYSLLQR